MSRVEVLIATMHRENTDFLRDMNIQTDATVVNQADSFSYAEHTGENGNRVRFITTAYRGLSKNRNLAFVYASGEFLLIADDDLRFCDGLEGMVTKAFDSLPQADIIVFNTKTLNMPETRLSREGNKKSFRVGLLNFSRYGSCSIAIRRSSLAKSRIKMSEFFGAGSGKISCGEDSVFLRDALRSGMKIYSYPATISVIDQSSSSWFVSCDEKFMYDKGAVCGTMFPCMGFVFKYYFAFKFSKKSELGFIKCVSLMRKGMKYAKKGISYDEYAEGKRR